MKIYLKTERDAGRLKSEMSYLANQYITAYKPSKTTSRKHGILKRLIKNKDIIIIRPDKGSGVVILNRRDTTKT